MQETWIRSLGWEDPLEKGMATHSSILAWRIPWTEEPGALQTMKSQRVRHDRVTNTHTHTHTHTHAHPIYVIRSNCFYMTFGPFVVHLQLALPSSILTHLHPPSCSNHRTHSLFLKQTIFFPDWCLLNSCALSRFTFSEIFPWLPCLFVCMPRALCNIPVGHLGCLRPEKRRGVSLFPRVCSSSRERIEPLSPELPARHLAWVSTPWKDGTLVATEKNREMDLEA